MINFTIFNNNHFFKGGNLPVCKLLFKLSVEPAQSSRLTITLSAWLSVFPFTVDQIFLTEVDSFGVNASNDGLYERS